MKKKLYEVSFPSVASTDHYAESYRRGIKRLYTWDFRPVNYLCFGLLSPSVISLIITQQVMASSSLLYFLSSSVCKYVKEHIFYFCSSQKCLYLCCTIPSTSDLGRGFSTELRCKDNADLQYKQAFLQ